MHFEQNGNKISMKDGKYDEFNDFKLTFQRKKNIFIKKNDLLLILSFLDISSRSESNIQNFYIGVYMTVSMELY